MATYYYDKTSPIGNAGFGTLTGNWSDASWSTSGAGTATSGIAWPGAGNVASFGGTSNTATGGTITAAGTIALDGIITQNLSNFQTFNGGALNFGSIATAAITVSADIVVNSDVVLASTGILTKNGAFGVTLNGQQSQIAGTVVHAGSGGSIIVRPNANNQTFFATTARFTTGSNAVEHFLFQTLDSNFPNFSINGTFTGTGRVNVNGDVIDTGNATFLGDLTGLTGYNTSTLCGLLLWRRGTVNLKNLPRQVSWKFGDSRTPYVGQTVNVTAEGASYPTTFVIYHASANNNVTWSLNSIAGGQAFSFGDPATGSIRRDTGESTGASTLILGGSHTGNNTVAYGTNVGTGSIALQKQDAGKWILAGNNAALASVLIGNGTLKATNSSAFGGTVTMSGTPTMEVEGGITIANTLNTVGTVRSVSGSNTLSGTLTLAGTTTFETQAGTLAMSGAAITGTGVALVFSGAGNTTCSKSINTSTNGTLTKNDAGTLTLSATSSNFTGAVTINGGVVEAASLDAGGSLGSGSALTLAGSGTLRYITGRTSVNLTRSLTAANIAGGFENNTGAALVIAPSSGGITGTSTVVLGGTGANQYNRLDAAVAAGGFTKTGAGRWISTNNNNLSGATTVSAGTLMADYNGWSAGTKLLGGDVTVAPGAKIQTGGGSNQKGRNSYTSLTFTGTVDNPARIRIGGASANPTIFLNGNLNLPTGSDKAIFDLSGDVFKSRETYRLIEFAVGKGITGGTAANNIGFTGLRAGLTATFSFNSETPTSLANVTVTIS